MTMRWLVALVLVGVAYGLTGLTQVRPGERGVVRRFGRVLPDHLEPGITLGLPWGMDRVDRVAVDKVQSVVVGYQEDDGSPAMPAGQLLTGNHNLVNVRVVVYYKVRADAVVDYVVQAERVDGLIARAAETVMGEWVAGRDVDDVLVNGKNRLPAVLMREAPARLDEYGLGVQLLDARVTLIAPPDEVKPAFDRVSSAQTGIATLVNKAEQDAASALRSAQADVYRTEQTTVAYVRGQTLLARSEAERFLKRLDEYREGRRRNPNYLRQIWEEERGKLFARLKDNGQLGLLDDHLGSGGLDLTIMPAVPKKP
jgi:membrane protease subunit HflK